VGVRLIVREKLWMFCAGLVFISVVLPFAVSQAQVATAVGDIVQCLLLSAILLSFLWNTKKTERRQRLFWALFATGGVMWLFTQVLWTYFEVIAGKPVPNPFVGDVILFLHLVPMMAALALQPERAHNEQSSTVRSIDFALLMIWWLFLYLFAVIPWQYVVPDEKVYGRSFDFLYMVEHFVFLIAVNAAWLRSRGKWKLLYGHLLGAASVYAMGSMAASIAIDLGQYRTGSIYDVPLTVAMAWFVAVGILGGKLKLHTESVPSSREARKGWFSALAMLAILSLPVMTGWALYASQTPSPVSEFRVILSLATMMIMATLIWIKQRHLDRQVVRANQELREDALTDSLTGARNRRFFNGAIAADVQQAIRSYLGPLSMQGKRDHDLIFYLIDADDFKAVNDRYGHDTGDVLLIEMARRISSAIRHSDVLIRWGGDEFLVLSRYTDRGESASLANRVLKAISDEPVILTNGISAQITCSIGWAAFPWFTDQPEFVPYDEVLRLADTALYEAKKRGRNRAVGMLPTRTEPASQADALDAANQRWSGYLAPETITVEGPNPVSGREPNSRTFVATQGS
jgi:diguanylate cyclase (GGDEF)-like protein